MKTKKLLTAALAAAMVGSVGMTQVAYAADHTPPADRISKVEIEKTLTVPNSINVALMDKNGVLLNGGSFQLIDNSGTVILDWTGNKGCLSANPNRHFGYDTMNMIAGELYETGDYDGNIRTALGNGAEGLLNKDDLITTHYGVSESYVAYGDKMTDVQSVTVPAGQVWLNVANGYKRAADQDMVCQLLELNGTDYDLSDLAGTRKTCNLPAGNYTVNLKIKTSPTMPTGSKVTSLTSSTSADEYVPLTLDLNKIIPKYISANGTHEHEGLTFTYSAPKVTDANNYYQAYLLVSSGAVTNVVALDGSSSATVYVKKGDYNPHFTCGGTYRMDTDTGFKSGSIGGHTDISFDIYNYAKHTLNLIAPPATGVTVGYIPAGTYTLHQTAAPDGYQLAADQTVTVKDSCQAADLQKISVVNTKSAEHTHTFSDVWTTDETSHWHAATCEHTDQVNDKAPHTYGEWTITQQPTTEQEGLREHKCTVCGYTQQEKLPPVAPEIPLTPLVPATPVNPDIPLTPLTPAEVVIPATPLEPGKPVEKPAKPVEPAKPAKPEAANPQTGDTGNLMLWSVAACAGLAGITLSLKKKKQQ